MKGLLYKELIQNKIVLIAFALPCVSFSIIMGTFPWILPGEGSDLAHTDVFAVMMTIVVIILNYFMLLAFQSNFFQSDEIKKWAYFVSSSPETAVGQVRTKYLFILFCDMGVLIWCYLFENIANAFQDTLTGTSMIYALLFFWHLFLSSIDIPFMIRFGTKGGNMCHTVMLVLFVAVGGIYFLFGDLTIFGSFDKIYDMIMNFLNMEDVSDWMILFLGLFVWISMGCYYLSYKLSCRFYLKGVEYYAK